MRWCAQHETEYYVVVVVFSTPIRKSPKQHFKVTVTFDYLDPLYLIPLALLI